MPLFCLYLFMIGINGPAQTQQMDFGDAPDSPYPTTLKNNGARHVILNGLSLGRRIDPEADGQATADATGDDLHPVGAANDEDGVVFTSPLTVGGTATLDVTVFGLGFLNAWIDLNANGSWADAGEQVLIGVPAPPGVHSLSFPIPAGAKIGPTFARFRLSQEGQVSFFGPGNAGVKSEADACLSSHEVEERAGERRAYQIVTKAPLPGLQGEGEDPQSCVC